MTALDFLAAELAHLQSSDLFRSPDGGPTAVDEYLNASSNDYLGLAREIVSRETTSEQIRFGAGASPLIHGRARAHAALEKELADWVGAEAALTFSSGYAANVGALSALAGPGDVIFSDALNHASIIDGCRLSRAHVVIVPHLDLAALGHALEQSPAARRRWFVTESYFSMDGDSPNLTATRELCDRTGAALYVDEAHALGVLGPGGAGLCQQASIVPDVLVGTLGKAVGVQGAFVAGSRMLRTWLWNKARSFVFSTGMSPALAGLILHNVQRARAASEDRERIATSAAAFVATLREHGVPIPEHASGHIIPILIGDNRRALTIAQRLRDAGILVQAIRPPTVPAGSARLRVTLSATLTEADLRYLTVQLLSAIHSIRSAAPLAREANESVL